MDQNDLNTLVKMTLPQLEQVVRRMLHNRGKGHIEANDVIHTAFILLWERGLEFNFVNMKGPLLDAMTQYTFNRNPATTAAVMGQEEKQCNKCKQVKPVALFYKANIYPNGLIIYQARCKVCADVICEAQKADRMQNATYKEEQKARRRARANAKLERIRQNPTLWEHYKEKWRAAQARSVAKKRAAAGAVLFG